MLKAILVLQECHNNELLLINEFNWNPKLRFTTTQQTW